MVINSRDAHGGLEITKYGNWQSFPDVKMWSMMLSW